MNSQSQSGVSPFSDIITLRDVQPDDREMLFEWRNRPAVARNMYVSRLIEREEHDHWFSESQRDPTKRYWIIGYHNCDAGLVNFYGIDRVNRRAHWAIYLNTEALQGKGIGGIVEFLILEYAFGHLQLNKLCCEVLEFNTSAVQMHKRFGFREEGVFRQHIFRDDHFCDVYCMAVLNDEWRQKRDEIENNLRRIADRMRRDFTTTDRRAQ